jgi:RHS repeat-associated protein
VVRRAHSQPGVDLTYLKQTGESNTDAGDQYTGLDRFGRVIDQRWIKTSDGSHTDRFKYGYDRNSNRLYRENLVNTVFSELYHANGASNGYDLLNQLTEFRRGTLSDTNSDGVPDTVATASRTQAWDYDALGNFDSQTSDGVAQTRTANKQNQIISISGAGTPAFDANGNMTGDEQGRALKYDAWNRLVELKQGATILASYAHDGLNRRGTEGTRTLYYSAKWQVIEERASGVAVVQAVFSPVYVDAITVRDRDTDGNGTLDERLWVQQDANWNITALLNGSGGVQERFIYDSFGSPIILDSSWSVRSSSQYSWVILHQGGRRDTATGLYDFRTRWLSPLLGRWIQVDPIGFLGLDVNVVRYLGNHPYSAVDPLGEKQQLPQPQPTRIIKDERQFGFFFDGAGRVAADNSNIHQLYTEYDSKDKFYYPISLVHAFNSSETITYSSAIADAMAKVSLVPKGNVQNIQRFDWEWHQNHADEGCVPCRRRAKQLTTQNILAKQIVYSIDLFGWSRGAVIAIDMANRLKEKGVKVRFLGVFDTCARAAPYPDYGTVPKNVSTAVNEYRDGNYDWMDRLVFTPFKLTSALGVDYVEKAWPYSHNDMGWEDDPRFHMLKVAKSKNVPFK